MRDGVTVDSAHSGPRGTASARVAAPDFGRTVVALAAPATGLPRPVLAWLALLVVLPLTLPYRWLPLTNLYQDAVAYALAVAGALVLLRSRREGAWRSLELPQVTAAPLALALVLVLQQLLGRIAYLQHFVVAVGVLLIAALTVTVAYRVLRPALGQTLAALAWAMLLAASVNSLWAAVQLAGVELRGSELVIRAEGPFRPGGLLAQPNQLAVLCVWGSVAAFYLVCSARLRAGTATAVVTFLAMTAATTASNTAYILFPLVGGVLSAWLWRQARPLWWLPAGVGMAFVCLAPLMDDLLRLLRLAGGLEADRALKGSTGPRVGFVADGWKIFLAHPWLGAGWHQFSAARWQLPSPVPIQLHADHAHNVVINLLAETGLLGFAAVCVPLAAWLWRASRAPLCLERLTLLVLLATVAVYSLFEFPLWLGHFLIPTALFIGMLEQRGAVLRVSPVFAALGRMTVALLLVGTLAAAADYGRVARAFRAMTGDSPRVYTVQELARLSNSTLYRREAEIAFVLSAPVDAAHAALNLELSRRVFLAWPVAHTGFVYASYLLYARQTDDALQVVARTCAWSTIECERLRTMFSLQAQAEATPFAAFLTKAFGSGDP